MQPEIITQWDHVPEIMSTLEGLHDYADLLGTHSINGTGNCSTLCVIVRDYDAQVIMTPWSDDLTKRFHIDWLRETFAMDHTVTRYAFIGEA
nr:hypothetical protein [uncultured Devosia sp.]